MPNVGRAHAKPISTNERHSQGTQSNLGDAQNFERVQVLFHVYKMEQAGEKIHSELNAIERQIWSIRNPQDRLWKYIERYELRNSLDLSIVKPVKKV